MMRGSLRISILPKPVLESFSLKSAIHAPKNSFQRTFSWTVSFIL